MELVDVIIKYTREGWEIRFREAEDGWLIVQAEKGDYLAEYPLRYVEREDWSRYLISAIELAKRGFRNVTELNNATKSA